MDVEKRTAQSATTKHVINFVTFGTRVHKTALEDATLHTIERHYITDQIDQAVHFCVTALGSTAS